MPRIDRDALKFETNGVEVLKIYKTSGVMYRLSYRCLDILRKESLVAKSASVQLRRGLGKF